MASGYDAAVDAVSYDPQISLITFGDRKVPFAAGETVTLMLGDAPEDKYTLTITPALADAGFETLRKLAFAMLETVNRGKNFRAYKIGDGEGYENYGLLGERCPARRFRFAWFI